VSFYAKRKSAGRGWIVTCLGIQVHRCATEREADLIVALQELVNEVERMRDAVLGREANPARSDAEALDRARAVLAVSDPSLRGM
jgi:hypothetical protein